MNVVDSSGWLEYFSNGENAGYFAAAIEDVDSLIVPSISIYEVYKRLLKQVSPDAARNAVIMMTQGLVVSLDTQIAVEAAQTSVEHKLSLADSIIYTTARRHHALFLTQDADFVGLDFVNYKPSPNLKQ